MTERRIRLAQLDEREQLRDIEGAAGAVFADVGLEDVAKHEPESVEGLGEYIDAGRAWVIVEDAAPVGYAVVDIVDGLAHLEQLSVRPEYGRRGLGAALLEFVCDWARRQHFGGITLTTFADLPWNAPFYAQHRFYALASSELGPELRIQRAEEAAAGLDPARRVCMRRDL